MIVYYVTSHGYGHAVRSCEVIRHLPPELPLLLRTGLPVWFLHSELQNRQHELAPAEFDCGVLGPDSARVDLELTVATLEEIQARNEARLDDEIRFLRDCKARVVICDAPSFPLRVARAAG